jgi:hypothetical protein
MKEPSDPATTIAAELKAANRERVRKENPYDNYSFDR